MSNSPLAMTLHIGPTSPPQTAGRGDLHGRVNTIRLTVHSLSNYMIPVRPKRVDHDLRLPHSGESRGILPMRVLGNNNRFTATRRDRSGRPALAGACRLLADFRSASGRSPHN